MQWSHIDKRSINHISYNNSIIQSKIDNPYDRCEHNIKSINALLNQFNSALELLEHERIEYNNNVTATQPIINELNEIIENFIVKDFKYFNEKDRKDIEEMISFYKSRIKNMLII